MEIGPNLCIWPVQSGINNHENEHGYELKSITKNISPIIQQNNSSFIYNHKNDILELESDSDIDNEIESTSRHPPPHNDRDHHKQQHQQYSHPSYQNHQEREQQHEQQHHQQTYDHLHGVSQCHSSHWDTTKLINLSIDEHDTDENNSVIIEDIDSNGNNNLHNDDSLMNQQSLYDEQSLSINEKHYHDNQQHHQNNSLYDLHQKNIQNKDYTCGFCGYDFDTPEQVEKHVLIKHSDHLIHCSENNKTINSTNTTTTDIPDKSVVLIDEQKKINDNTGLLQKEKKLPEKDKLLTTILNSSISDVQIDDPLSIKNNINNNKDISTPTMNPMITDCPLCDRTFVGRRSLNIHLNKTHSIRENNNSNSNNTSMDTTNTTVSVSNTTKMMNNTNTIDVEQSKCNSQMKLTRLSHSYSLKGNNRNLKVFTESIKSSSNEKSSCKIAVRPPLLPRPSRSENSAIHTSVSS
ncbi:unnamed protein product, partial [Trichobilharzia regenti]